ncbi:hypothetical protein [Nocardia altamirensis]|uniref:hypothetical protein n=1 Tax=Nocardia altamirensis TaxID=472158 RepID=UPI00114CD416|nr:hypothetical protein [Nocardia altamirensis]
MTVRRLVIRGAVAGVIAVGSIVVVAPSAVADNPCEGASARVFFGNSTNTCQSGSAAYSNPTIVSKICSMPTSSVHAEVTLKQTKTKTITQTMDLANGQCGRFPLQGQLSSTVTVS